jgi:hypothetical protein
MARKLKLEDAKSLTYLLLSADGGCSYCAHALLRDAVQRWAATDWDKVLQGLDEDDARLLRLAIKDEDFAF